MRIDSLGYLVKEADMNKRISGLILILVALIMVKNYRTQFREILAKNSPEKLLEILRDKVNKT